MGGTPAFSPGIRYNSENRRISESLPPAQNNRRPREVCDRRNRPSEARRRVHGNVLRFPHTGGDDRAHI